MVTLGVDLPSEKLSFGAESFDDGFSDFVELLPPRAKLSLGGDSLEVDSFGDESLGVDSFNVDSVGACNLLLTGAGFSLLVVD
ncbi:hydroxylamine reductase [Moritella sp. PE36]|nr:hydroxylamine reductase [Moritella sp. PE36]